MVKQCTFGLIEIYCKFLVSPKDNFVKEEIVKKTQILRKRFNEIFQTNILVFYFEMIFTF